ncbi:MAG: hypothetical protein NCW75_10055 [Phycisphaera sp.]|nr:MAG: hypothetical protein NCW75_10055 [Phycisphaera sp.]
MTAGDRPTGGSPGDPAGARAQARVLAHDLRNSLCLMRFAVRRLKRVQGEHGPLADEVRADLSEEVTSVERLVNQMEALFETPREDGPADQPEPGGC